tara:strand:+ start:2822 stop:4084 length:1263 start_codon:yes stop_codon:yes gene_type:complete
MNKRQIANRKKYEMAKIDTIERPGAIDRKYFAKILMADSNIRDTYKIRSFDGIASHIATTTNNYVSVANPGGKKKDMVAFNKLGFVDGYENSRCKCNGAHHEISILPSGEMILHAHDIDNDDEKKTQVLQALSRLGGGNSHRTNANKSEHRCAEIKRLYNKAMENPRNGLRNLSDSEKAKLPGWIQRVVVARGSMAKLATGYGFRPHDLDYIRDTSIWNNAYTNTTIEDRYHSVLHECYETWRSLLWRAECWGGGFGTMHPRVWVRLYLRTRLLWAQTDEEGYHGRRSIILAADPKSRGQVGSEATAPEKDVLTWFDFNMCDEAINEWNELVKLGSTLQESWMQLLEMAYSNRPTRVLAWNSTDKLFFADCKRGPVAVNYSWRPRKRQVTRKQVELFLGDSTETTIQDGWNLTNIFRIQH